MSLGSSEDEKEENSFDEDSDAQEDLKELFGMLYQKHPNARRYLKDVASASETRFNFLADIAQSTSNRSHRLTEQ